MPKIRSETKPHSNRQRGRVRVSMLRILLLRVGLSRKGNAQRVLSYMNEKIEVAVDGRPV